MLLSALGQPSLTFEKAGMLEKHFSCLVLEKENPFYLCTVGDLSLFFPLPGDLLGRHGLKVQRHANQQWQVAACGGRGSPRVGSRLSVFVAQLHLPGSGTAGVTEICRSSLKECEWRVNVHSPGSQDDTARN